MRPAWGAFRPISNTPESELSHLRFITGDISAWGTFRPVLVLSSLNNISFKIYKSRYLSLGNMQTSLNTSKSKLSHLKFVTGDTSAWGAFRPVLVLSSLSYLI